MRTKVLVNGFDMSKDAVYTGGVIAVKENVLLKDKIFKLCETDAEEALRVITESGFGKGAEVDSAYGFETLIAAEERDLDEFVREYAPNTAVSAYIFAPRDFHNMKSLIKARNLGESAESMLAPEGAYTVKLLSECIEKADFSPLDKELASAAETVCGAGNDEGNTVVLSGSETGMIFEKAFFRYLARVCKRSGFLKKLIAKKADMLNILTALRSGSPEFAAKNFVDGGKLSRKRLEKLFGDDRERAARSFADTPYHAFVKVCFSAIEKGLPFTEAERLYESIETIELSKKKYELKNSEPFLYYVFRRHAEIANVRILFVCLLSGMDESGIKNRLRAI